MQQKFLCLCCVIVLFEYVLRAVYQNDHFDTFRPLICCTVNHVLTGPVPTSVLEYQVSHYTRKLSKVKDVHVHGVVAYSL